MQSIRNARCHKKEHLAKVEIRPPPPLLFTTDMADLQSLLQNGPHSSTGFGLTLDLATKQLIVITIFGMVSSLFAFLTDILLLFKGVLMEYNTSVKEASTKVIITKMVIYYSNYDQLTGCQIKMYTTVELIVCEIHLVT